MRKILFAAAALLCSAAVPAIAAWDSLGTVDVSRRPDHDMKYTNFGGPVEGLQLQAERSDITCSAVTADFGNGRMQKVFSGRLREGRPADVDLPGDQRRINSLSFNCRAQDRSGGTIRISANVGRYESEWQKSPDWGRMYSRMFNWGSKVVNDWTQIGSERFEGRNDSETTFAGWKGRNVDSIALMPVETDARCSRVSADFRKDRDQTLGVNNGDALRRGQYYKIDLPGDRRDITSLRLNCRAIGARAVTINIFTGK